MNPENILRIAVLGWIINIATFLITLSACIAVIVAIAFKDPAYAQKRMSELNDTADKRRLSFLKVFKSCLPFVTAWQLLRIWNDCYVFFRDNEDVDVFDFFSLKKSYW